MIAFGASDSVQSLPKPPPQLMPAPVTPPLWVPLRVTVKTKLPTGAS